MACEHPNLTVRQDPNDGRKEILSCPDCKIEKSRVSAAASIQDAAEAQLAAMRADAAEHRGQLDTLAKVVEAQQEVIRGAIDRLAKPESFGGVA